jgi:hypothetical protein
MLTPHGTQQTQNKQTPENTGDATKRMTMEYDSMTNFIALDIYAMRANGGGGAARGRGVRCAQRLRAPF